MRDPLSRVRIRHKLPLTFLAVCLVAFGGGGVVLTTQAREALEREIERRLDERAASTGIVVERHLDLHRRRAEDFASDGFLRRHLELLLDADGAEGPAAREAREALAVHLQRNKLPLVPAFVGAAIHATDGARGAAWPPELDSESDLAALPDTGVGPLRPASADHPYPTFRISTPVRSLAGDRRIGTLQLLLRADAWVASMTELERLPDMHLKTFRLHAATGVSLPLLEEAGAEDGRDGGGAAPPSETIAYRRPVEGTDWTLDLEADRSLAMAPARRLRNQYLLIGLALLLLTAGVLFFPVRFLLQPLSKIAEAARRLGQGDFRARADHESGDEIGDLAHAFNYMADAVEDRTRRLEAAAEALRRREEDARVERDRLDTVIRGMEDGLFILDGDGRVTLANAAARPLIEAMEAEGGARGLDCRHAAKGGPQPGCLGCLSNSTSGHQSCVIELAGRIYEIHTTTLPAARQGVTERLCVSRDVTERIARQEAQAHQERMAVLGEIAATMAHELNNPLAAISMFSQMLEEQLEEGTDLRESADVIRRNVATCKRTIRGLLDLAARGRLDSSPFDVNDLLVDVQAFLQPVAERRGVALEVVPEAKDASIVGDEVRLRQVLINLVMNALQACDAGGRVVIASRDDEGAVAVDVVDDGPGIPEDVQGRIFEAFFTTKEAGVGTGLGLPTSRRIAEEHGGTLRLVATGDAGTTFRLRLPRDTTRPDWEAKARREAELHAAEPGESSRG